MAPEAIRRIRNGLAAWSSGDLDGALANLRPDIEFVTSGLFLGVEPVYRGHDGFRRFWHDFRDTWERIRIDVEAIVAGDPSRFAVVGHFHATGRDGIGVERHVGMVFVTTAEDQISRIESYGTWDETFDAAGVPATERSA